MKFDVYKRPEADHKLSYMLVPAGQSIPQEADNVDWHLVKQGDDLDTADRALQGLGIDHAMEQIREKGYAITSVYHQVEGT